MKSFICKAINILFNRTCNHYNMKLNNSPSLGKAVCALIAQFRLEVLLYLGEDSSGRTVVKRPGFSHVVFSLWHDFCEAERLCCLQWLPVLPRRQRHCKSGDKWTSAPCTEPVLALCLSEAADLCDVSSFIFSGSLCKAGLTSDGSTLPC